MKKVSTAIILVLVFVASSLFAFDEAALRNELLNYNKVIIPITLSVAAGKIPNNPVKPPTDSEWITADSINAKLELIIKKIDDVKGIAMALSVIIDLYESEQISAEVAITIIRILKLRAFFLKLFITDGNNELELVINIITQQESDFVQKVGYQKQKY